MHFIPTLKHSVNCSLKLSRLKFSYNFVLCYNRVKWIWKNTYKWQSVLTRSVISLSQKQIKFCVKLEEINFIYTYIYVLRYIYVYVYVYTLHFTWLVLVNISVEKSKENRGFYSFFN